MFFRGAALLDLRDAEVSFTVAGNAFEVSGAAMHFWISRTERDGAGRFWSQWALTAHPFPDEAFRSTNGVTVSFRLVNDPRPWTYTGSNPKEHREEANRYRRLSLNETLSVSNSGFVLAFGFGDMRCPLSGKITFFDAALRHRDYSVLSQYAGTELNAFPTDSLSDPLNLTRGKRGVDGAMWTSTPLPSYPLTFTWRLARATPITHIQINQNPYWPAKEAALLAGCNGQEARTIWSGVLPEAQPHRSELPFLAHHLDQEFIAEFVTLRIFSGHRPERCGLDSVEVYGNGVEFVGDGQPCSISTEISNAVPGSIVYFRAAIEEEGLIVAGEIQSLKLPIDQSPFLESAQPVTYGKAPFALLVRGNAMGLETEIWGELRLPDGAVHRGPKVSFGSQPTGRHLIYRPAGIPDLPGDLRLCARNVAGESTLGVAWP